MLRVGIAPGEGRAVDQGVGREISRKGAEGKAYTMELGGRRCWISEGEVGYVRVVYS